MVTNGARPAGFDAIVARAIAKNPANRYPDALAMRAALQALSRTPATAGAKATVILPIPRDGEQPVTTSAVSPSVASPKDTTPPPARDAALSSGASGTSMGTAGWDPTELARIERALATHVGPMARVMVRDAARTHADPVSLATAVGRHITDETKRHQFVEQVRGGSQVTPVGSPTASGATPIPQAASAAPAADPLSDDFKTHVTQIVTRKMGPIARVMVRRAADASGGSQARFVQAVLDAIPEADRWAVQGEINKLG